MSRLYSIVLLSLVITLLSGCGQKKSSPQPAREFDYPFRGMGPLIAVVDTTRSQIYEVDKYGTINLFGVKLVGSISSILNSLDSIPYLEFDQRTGERARILHDDNRVLRYSTKVFIDDIPFGMNIEYLKSDPDVVDGVYFITSDTRDYICDAIVDRLIKYYGDPDVFDFNEDSYGWYEPYDFIIRFRHLHSLDGGWTFYFYR